MDHHRRVDSPEDPLLDHPPCRTPSPRRAFRGRSPSPRGRRPSRTPPAPRRRTPTPPPRCCARTRAPARAARPSRTGTRRRAALSRRRTPPGRPSPSRPRRVSREIPAPRERREGFRGAGLFQGSSAYDVISRNIRAARGPAGRRSSGFFFSRDPWALALSCGTDADDTTSGGRGTGKGRDPRVPKGGNVLPILPVNQGANSGHVP